MTRLLRIMASLAAGAVLLPLSTQAQTPKNECFFLSQFQNWKAGGDDKTIYIRVSSNRFYRLDMANRCPELAWPGAIMVNTFRGSTICSPLDFDMKISRGPGSIAGPCIVKTMTRLSVAEALALPKKQKP